MARLGNNFVIMLGVQFNGSQEALSNIVSPLAGSMDLKQSLMEIEEGSHDIEPDIRINIYSNERRVYRVAVGTLDIHFLLGQ